MPSSVNAFRVFIASPGGLDAERLAIREEVDKFNRELMHDSGAAFTPEGWEDVPGGRRRAQEQINEHLAKCDYMILVLADRWGSPPAKDGTFTSGTEEEFELARRLIDEPDQPMTDILILFKGVSDAQLRDPGPQLQSVLQFKKSLEESKEWLYKTFDDMPALRHEIASRLLAWARVTSGETFQPEAQHSRSGLEADATDKGASGARPLPTGDEDPASLLERAEGYAEAGLMTQAEAAFAQAIADGDVAALESYARFLRRAGRSAKSLDVNRQLLDRLAGEAGEEAMIKRARVLANIGITERKQGDLRASRYSLTEAEKTIVQSGPEAQSLRAYILDNLGITAVRIGDVRAAREHYEKALQVRKDAGDADGQAKSLVNIARLDKRLGDTARAKASCLQAVELLRASTDAPSLATALSAFGEILEVEGDVGGAEAAYREALAINEGLGRPANIAMSFMHLARVLVENGDIDDAERYARRALQENEVAYNQEGVVASRLLLGRVLALNGRAPQGVGLMEEAVAGYAEMGNPNGEAWARFYLSEALATAGRAADAHEGWETARSLATAAGNAQLVDKIQSALHRSGQASGSPSDPT